MNDYRKYKFSVLLTSTLILKQFKSTKYLPKISNVKAQEYQESIIIYNEEKSKFLETSFYSMALA